MTIQPIGDESVALYITPAELHSHGLTPESLTAERALALTKDAFAQAGIEPEGPIEIEAYPENSGVLVFAHVRPPERLWASFADFEDLLDALRALPEPPEDAALTWWEERWWLSLPNSARQAHAVLGEFGRTEPSSPQRDACLAEHGSHVLAGDAVSALLHYFPAP